MIHVPVQELVDMMFKISPFILLGAFTGFMCSKTNVDCHEEISRIHGRYADITQDVLRVTANVTEKFAELRDTCMRNDRFEFVDVTKEEKK